MSKKNAPLDPEKVAGAVRKTQNEANAEVLANFDWATHAVKLNRAIAFVQERQPGLKGKEQEDAVKERYVALNGLLATEDTVRVSKNGGKVVNVADDDGSKD